MTAVCFRGKTPKVRGALFACILTLLCPPVYAGQATGDIQPNTALDRQAAQQGEGLGFFNDPSFLVVPIPISNPTIGSGAALVTAMLFRTDEESKSSLVGLGGFYTSNGSWGAAAMTDIAFEEDRYRARGSGGYASVTYDFYGIGANPGNRHVSLTQSGSLFQGAFLARAAPDFYAGVQLRRMSIRTAFNLPGLAGEILDNGGPISRIDNNITTMGLVASYDSRNKDYAPSQGMLIDVALDLGLQDFVANNSFMRSTVSFNRYDQLDDDLVLASHASLCGAGGKVPIFNLCLFGAQNDLRGYPVGHYQDKAMYTVQEELRWHAFWRVGLVAFAGFGAVAPTFDKFSKMLASGGAGLRFLASREYGLNVGIDGAVNAQGEASFYIMVGEAF